MGATPPPFQHHIRAAAHFAPALPDLPSAMLLARFGEVRSCTCFAVLSTPVAPSSGPRDQSQHGEVVKFLLQRQRRSVRTCDPRELSIQSGVLGKKSFHFPSLPDLCNLQSIEGPCALLPRSPWACVAPARSNVGRRLQMGTPWLAGRCFRVLLPSYIYKYIYT